MTRLPVYRKSFFTGQDRADGLRLDLHYASGLVYSDMMVGRAFEGYENVAHGGMLFGILDVIMWYTILIATKKICMTRKTEVEFLKPVACGAPYRAQGRFLGTEGRDFWVSSWIEDAQEERCVDVKALFREPREIDRERLLSKLDFTGVSAEIRELFLPGTL
jgi:acyl-coenzyme A thioesterase PaaI-like protein